jgi:hypothetical protein
MHPMKKLLVLWSSLAVAAGLRAALPQPDLLAQIHFAGAQKISAEANAAAFTNEFCSAEAQAVRTQTADKLAPWLAGWLQKKSGVTVPAGTARLRPLFDDLQTAEWLLEARTTANGQPEVALAVRLPETRAALWRAELKVFFPAATFKTAGAWLIFDTGPDAPKLGDRLAQKISAPPAGWLALDLNWPRLAQWFPDLQGLDLPETQLAVTAANASLHLNGKFFFPNNLALEMEPWHLPTNTVHQPFVSFTAARGLAGWWRTQPWLQPYQISPPPNQLFVWALQGIPFQTYAAIPVANAASALQQAYARLSPIFAASNPQGFGPFTLDFTNNEITMGGVPFIAPFIEAKAEPAGQFLLAGAFPNTPRSKPLPAELFKRLAEPNLLFYHWEITAERMPQLLNLAQLGLVLTSHQQLDADAPAGKWVLQITPKLGNTITEITQTGPAEMTFSRTAPGGLTAAEFFALASWLGANNFPGCDLRLPPRAPRIKRPHPPTSNAISIPAPAH